MKKNDSELNEKLSNILSELPSHCDKITIKNLDKKIKNISVECLKLNAKTSEKSDFISNLINSFSELFLIKKMAFAALTVLLVVFLYGGFNKNTVNKTIIASNSNETIAVKQVNNMPPVIISEISSNNSIVNTSSKNNNNFELLAIKGTINFISNNKKAFIKEKERFNLNGLTAIAVSSSSKCRLASSYCVIDINENSFVEASPFKINIKSGSAFFNFNEKLRTIYNASFDKSFFSVITPDINIKIIGTIFSVNVASNETTVKVMNGKIKISSNDENLNYSTFLSAGDNFLSNSSQFKIVSDNNLTKSIFKIKNDVNNQVSSNLNIVSENKISKTETAEVISNQSAEILNLSYETNILTSNGIDHRNKEDTIETANLPSNFVEEQEWLNSIKITDKIYYEKLINMNEKDRRELYLKNKKVSDVLNNLK